MPHANRLGERTAEEVVLRDLLGGATDPLLVVTATNGAAVRLEVATPVATGRALSLHEWIPMGALSDRTQCRCCHCGVVRSYDLSSDPRVSYWKYSELLCEGELETTEVPACAPAQSRMPLSVGARSWDMLSWI